MSDCCCSSHCKPSHPVKHICPVNGQEYPEVSRKTVRHHIKQSWLWDSKEQPYYFCDDPDCDVVYFGIDDSVILKSQMRTVVGVKEDSDTSLVCYCYGATKADILDEASIRQFVTKQTKSGDCSCETSNPAGCCCLKYFPKKRH